MERKLRRCEKAPCRWKPSPVGTAATVHAAAVEPILARLTREVPREGVRSNQNRSEHCDRDGRGRLHRPRWRTTPPARLQASNRGECSSPKRRSQAQRVRLLPRPSGGPQSPSQRAERKPCGLYREPASTGTRSHEFGKQTSDERIGGCLSGGALQRATSREVPSLKDVGTR